MNKDAIEKAIEALEQIIFRDNMQDYLTTPDELMCRKALTALREHQAKAVDVEDVCLYRKMCHAAGYIDNIIITVCAKTGKEEKRLLSGVIEDIIPRSSLSTPDTIAVKRGDGLECVDELKTRTAPSKSRFITILTRILTPALFPDDEEDYLITKGKVNG
jgi:hypothetical protein